jgi:geranylgeranyl reductase family protein
MKIAIIGAGPAGSHLAGHLTKGGVDITLFHRGNMKEKPCGGGITYRLVKEYPFLKNIEDQANRIKKIIIYSPSNIKAELVLHEPLLVFSRQAFDSFLLQQAKKAGGKIIEGKVTALIDGEGGWVVETKDSSYDAFDYLVGADGASGISRKILSKPFPKNNITQTFGFFIEGATDDCIRLKFFNDHEGYAWSFPRRNNINIGLGSPLGKKSSKQLRDRIHDFMANYLPSYEGKNKESFGALIPSIDLENNDHLRNISGKNWALIGDAGGITDPITGEGIYYAIRTATILGDAIIQRQPHNYSSTVREVLGNDISWAYSNRSRFFTNEFIDVAVEACSRSEEIASIVAELFAGMLPYASLPSRLLGLALKTDISLLGKLISHLR